MEESEAERAAADAWAGYGRALGIPDEELLAEHRDESMESGLLEKIEVMFGQALGDLDAIHERALALELRPGAQPGILKSTMVETTNKWRDYFTWYLEAPSSGQTPSPRVVELATKVLRDLDALLEVHLRGGGKLSGQNLQRWLQRNEMEMKRRMVEKRQESFRRVQEMRRRLL